jgi:hypothetical protein
VLCSMLVAAKQKAASKSESVSILNAHRDSDQREKNARDCH